MGAGAAGGATAWPYRAPWRGGLSAPAVEYPGPALSSLGGAAGREVEGSVEGAPVKAEGERSAENCQRTPTGGLFLWKQTWT